MNFINRYFAARLKFPDLSSISINFTECCNNDRGLGTENMARGAVSPSFNYSPNRTLSEYQSHITISMLFPSTRIHFPKIARYSI